MKNDFLIHELQNGCYVAAAKSLQLCPTLCDPIDGSPPGSAIPGILQARTLECFAISFSNAWNWKVNVKSLSRVWLFVTPWTAAYQAPPSMGFSRHEYWSRLSLPFPTRGRNEVKGQKVIKMENTLQRNLVLVTSGISELFGQHIEWEWGERCMGNPMERGKLSLSLCPEL